MPTLVLFVLTYAGWVAITGFAAGLGPWLAVPLLAVVLAQHSSLQHEVIHGHPTRNQRLNEALVFPALGLLIPYERFRDMHLAHHYDPLLTDPHDDPESNYLDPAVWARLRRPVRALLAVNNTLLGRMLIGPFLGMARSGATISPRSAPATGRVGAPGLHHLRESCQWWHAGWRSGTMPWLAVSAPPAGWRCRSCGSAPSSSTRRTSARGRAA